MLIIRWVVLRFGGGLGFFQQPVEAEGEQRDADPLRDADAEQYAAARVAAEELGGKADEGISGNVQAGDFPVSAELAGVDEQRGKQDEVEAALHELHGKERHALRRERVRAEDHAAGDGGYAVAASCAEAPDAADGVDQRHGGDQAVHQRPEADAEHLAIDPYARRRTDQPTIEHEAVLQKVQHFGGSDWGIRVPRNDLRQDGDDIQQLGAQGKTDDGEQAAEKDVLPVKAAGDGFVHGDKKTQYDSNRNQQAVHGDGDSEHGEAGQHEGLL